MSAAAAGDATLPTDGTGSAAASDGTRPLSGLDSEPRAAGASASRACLYSSTIRAARAARGGTSASTGGGEPDELSAAFSSGSFRLMRREAEIAGGEEGGGIASVDGARALRREGAEAAAGLESIIAERRPRLWPAKAASGERGQQAAGRMEGRKGRQVAWPGELMGEGSGIVAGTGAGMVHPPTPSTNTAFW